MRRFAASLAAVAAVLVVLGFIATPVASAQQSVNFSIGGFTPRGFDGRSNDDVLVNNMDFLLFDVNDLNGPVVNADWLIGFGDWLEGGLGIGWYSRTSPAIYRNFTNADGSEIEQDLKLRVIPFSATVRILPLGRNAGIQPYIGGGVGVLQYRYSESGGFIDFGDLSIFNSTYVGSGTATGPVILGGIRFPVSTTDIGFEMRHQSGKAELPPEEQFAGPEIDLGGMNYLFTINVRF